MSELSDADISGLNALGHALRLFKEIAPNIPASAVEAFIMIATRQGKSISAYARQANVQFNHIARQVADLSRMDRNNRPGLDFVEKRAGQNEREVLLYLTPRGREFARKLAGCILPVRPANPARDAAEALFCVKVG